MGVFENMVYSGRKVYMSERCDIAGAVSEVVSASGLTTVSEADLYAILLWDGRGAEVRTEAFIAALDEARRMGLTVPDTFGAAPVSARVFKYLTTTSPALEVPDTY